MTELSLLSSSRLCSLMHDTLTWPDSQDITSMLISSKNGSILAYAYRDTEQIPGVKALRTKSTTLTTAYAASVEDSRDAEDEILVVGNEDSSMSVVIGIGEQVVLAVSSGETPQGQNQAPKMMWNVHEGHEQEDALNTEDTEANDDQDEAAQDSDHGPLREALGNVAAELGEILRDELKELRWPEDM